MQRRFRQAAEGSSFHHASARSAVLSAAGSTVPHMLEPRSVPRSLGRGVGLMEANFAAAVGQLSHEDEASQLVVDSREILAAGARLVGAQLGEAEIDTYIALSGAYVEQGARDSGDVETTKGALTRTVYGRRIGGRDRSIIHTALVNLFRMELQFSGVDAHSGEFDTEFVALERLLVRLEFNRQIRYRESAPHRYDPALAGAEHDGTIKARFAEWHVSQMQRGYWVELDWEMLRSLSGAAKLLWLVLSSPRIAFRACEDAPHLEQLRTTLTLDGYRALGINSADRRNCKQRLLKYGRRLIAVDGSYVDFEVAPSVEQPGAHELTVLRRRVTDQLALDLPAAAA